ncbi:MAG: hypothetical protein ACLTBV_09065 [Enterocloster bolteae]
MGEGTAGTTVINETSMPMVVLGAKDMIVQPVRMVFWFRTSMPAPI